MELILQNIEKIAWMLAGWLLKEVYDWGKKKITRIKYKSLIKKLKKELGTLSYSNWEVHGECIAFDHAYPCYKEKNIKVIDSEKSFFWQIPDSRRLQLTDYGFEFRDEVKLDNNEKLLSIISENYPDIKNIGEFLHDVACETADGFINDLKLGKTRFNNKKFGINHISVNRKGNEEENTLTIKVFTTDYFTFYFMTNLYNKLRAKNDIFKVSKIEEVNQFTPFLCSLGVGGFVMYNNGEEEEIFIGRRSSSVRSGNTWHFTFDEGFTNQDMNDYGNFDVYSCIKRGLNEELNICKEHSDSIISICPTEIAIVVNERFELKLPVYVKIKFSKEFTIEDMMRFYRTAKDAKLETETITPMPLLQAQSFLLNKKATPECRLLIETMTIRKRKNLL